MVQGREPVPPTRQAREIPMAYVIEHWTSTKRHYRTIDNICITNLYCGYGKGWDIVVYGTIMDHKTHKSDAQREAEKLLDGTM